MPPSLGDRLFHILESIDDIQALLAGQTEQSIMADRPRWLAIERSFEIICEASRHVPEAIKAQETGVDWRRMTDLGNLLRHAYHRINAQRLLTIAGKDLPPLKAFVERIIREEKKR